MQALILSCSTGGGHNSAAKAMVKALDSAGWQTTFFDPYTLRSQKLADLVSGAYVELVRFSPRLFGKVYQIGRLYEKAENAFSLPSPVMAAQKKTARALQEYLTSHSFDLILCTHPYPGMMLTLLRKQHFPLPLTVMVATDYTCIPFETQVDTDRMVIGSPDLSSEFIQAGTPAWKLLPFGIPVDPRYEKGPVSRLEALHKLDLNPCYRYVLVGGGSMGAGGMKPLLGALQGVLTELANVRMIILCGTSASLYESVAALHHPGLIPVAFSDRMDLWMSASDVYLTKPGGLTITEASAMGMPLILAQPIPGCESANADFFESRGMARVCSDLGQLSWIIRDLMNPEQSEAMKKAQKDFLPHHSARALTDWIGRELQTQPHHE